MALCRKESGIFSNANENPKDSDGNSVLETGLNRWKLQVAAALKGGAGDLQSMILKVILAKICISIILLYSFIWFVIWF